MCFYKLWSNSSTKNSMVMFTHSVLEGKYLFYGKFISKNQNCLLKLKSGTYTSSNMKNSMVISSIFKSYLAHFPVPALKFLIFFPKKFLIFREMEHSSPKIKKVLKFSQKKLFLYFEKWNFLEKLLIFQKGTCKA